MNTRTATGTIHTKGVNDLRVTACHKFIEPTNTDTAEPVTCKRCLAKIEKAKGE